MCRQGVQKAPYLEYFRMHTWFMVALPAWRLTHAAARSAGLGAYLPLLGAAIHFGCYGDNCAWPFLRHPYEHEVTVAAYGYFGGSRLLKGAMAALPQNSLSDAGPLALYYFTLPALLPADFPAALPSPLPPGAGGSRSSGRSFLARALRALSTQTSARRFWLLALSMLLALTALPAEPGPDARRAIDAALWHSKRAYGCSKAVFPPRALAVRTDALQPCGPGGADAGWSVSRLALDVAGVTISVAASLGLAAAMPRGRTFVTEAGGRTLVVYVLHLYVVPALEPPTVALVQVVAYSIHPEAAAIAAAAIAALVVHALALPLPLPLGRVSVLLHAARRAARDGVAACLETGRRMSAARGHAQRGASGEAEPLVP